MSLRIDADRERFSKIVRGKIQSNLKKLVSSGDMIGQVGGKIVKIPIHSIDLPRFAFGSRDQGGNGMGDGDEGDPMPGQGKKKGKGKGEASDGTEEHSFDMEFSAEEMADIMISELELPKLENKGKGKINSEKNKYNKVANLGPDSLRHNQRTFKEALKRNISSGNYNPNDPYVIPIKADKRFRSYSTKEVPDVNAVVIHIADISGSMQEAQRKIIQAEVFWIDLLLTKSYKDIASVFIVHDTEAKEVSREDFFKMSSGGGTQIASAYKLVDEIISTRYPFSDMNNYVFQYSDGDNFSTNDDCGTLLTEKILPNVNQFCYGQVKSQGGSGEFIDYLGARFADNEKVVLSQIDSEDDILRSIKDFFERGR
jgi:uncharacterized sporulation protein YeaH/YhbH (DUF444 family)